MQRRLHWQHLHCGKEKSYAVAKLHDIANLEYMARAEYRIVGIDEACNCLKMGMLAYVSSLEFHSISTKDMLLYRQYLLQSMQLLIDNTRLLDLLSDSRRNSMYILWQLMLAIPRSMEYSTPRMRHAKHLDFVKDAMGKFNFPFLSPDKINCEQKRLSESHDIIPSPEFSILYQPFSQKIPTELRLKNKVRLAAWFNRLRAYSETRSLSAMVVEIYSQMIEDFERLLPGNLFKAPIKNPLRNVVAFKTALQSYIHSYNLKILSPFPLTIRVQNTPVSRMYRVSGPHAKSAVQGTAIQATYLIVMVHSGASVKS